MAGKTVDDIKLEARLALEQYLAGGDGADGAALSGGAGADISANAAVG